MTSAVEARIHAVAPESIAIQIHLKFFVLSSFVHWEQWCIDITPIPSMSICTKTGKDPDPRPMPDGKSGELA
jgi:hypothetical protein